ncbi:G patch domain-containing protein 4 [Pseudoliparis swirei]|uniref:G patch domain-containing protein 4 n=1 Tax=Pseudoliparis swirei TaxID=2059687 RepID=UPI0024BE3EF5|nr:G patch domain-containing protein 4 [Pseudoliparis swirei]XP_056261911.1 G patch domain-containing protein 4 [Pseudoliparis swirei]
MSEVVPEKSRGLKFAERQLLRHGWERGKGLGRGEDGISEAIKIKVKCDKGGIGHKEGDQFTFHWWDHVFNKASSSLQVESDQNGIQLKKTVDEDEEDGMISNKRPRKAALAKEKLYGCFVKSSALLSGQKQPEPKASSSDSSSSDDEDQNLDLSSATQLSDADLMRACGGRTAHKGARHGLTMSAKLARLERQEAEFMATYEKKSAPASVAPTTPTPPAPAERREETARDETRSTGGVIELNDDEPDVKPKKKKKKKAGEDTEEITDVVSSEEEEDDVIWVENSEADQSHESKRKSRKRKTNAGEGPPSPEETEVRKKREEKKKKKRKSSKAHSEEGGEGDGTESGQSEAVQVFERRAADTPEEEEEEKSVRQKRKKCKKDKCVDADEEETHPPKKKKKKSKEYLL